MLPWCHSSKKKEKKKGFPPIDVPADPTPVHIGQPRLHRQVADGSDKWGRSHGNPATMVHYRSLWGMASRQLHPEASDRQVRLVFSLFRFVVA